MIKSKPLRIGFYVVVCLVFILDLFMIYQGLFKNDSLNFGSTLNSNWSIKASQSRWIAYHVWNIIVLFFLVWSENKKQRGLFLLTLILATLLFYYPILTH
jgi:hypothetical protein